MPWGSGVYTRTNGQYTGANIWATDAANAIKIESVRHDTHDQDLANGISACLNINGQNAMATDLNVGSNKIISVAAGTSSTDAVNKGQLDGLNTIITSQSWDGDNFTSNRGAGPFTTAIVKFNSFKSNGPIRHVLNNQGSGAATIDVAAKNYHRIDNTGALTITFTNVPSASDSDLGADYVVQGNIVVRNGASPGNITIAGLTSPRVIGSESLTASGVCVLSYILQRVSGATEATLMWSSDA